MELFLSSVLDMQRWSLQVRRQLVFEWGGGGNNAGLLPVGLWKWLPWYYQELFMKIEYDNIWNTSSSVPAHFENSKGVLLLFCILLMITSNVSFLAIGGFLYFFLFIMTFKNVKRKISRKEKKERRNGWRIKGLLSIYVRWRQWYSYDLLVKVTFYLFLPVVSISDSSVSDLFSLLSSLYFILVILPTSSPRNIQSTT